MVIPHRQLPAVTRTWRKVWENYITELSGIDQFNISYRKIHKHAVSLMMVNMGPKELFEVSLLALYLNRASWKWQRQNINRNQRHNYETNTERQRVRMRARKHSLWAMAADIIIII